MVIPIFLDMKKYFNPLLVLSLFLVLTACGNKENGYENLTPLQSQAVSYVKKHLERGDKLLDCQVVEEPMPVSILEQPFLDLRNEVFKAGMDYQSCQTRGLEAGMKMAQNKIDTARVKILSTEEMLTKNIGSNQSVIVLANVKMKRHHEPSSLIVVFDPETMEVKEWIPVTVPVQNTVALVVCAKDNTLTEYAREMNHDTSMLTGRVTDPVLKFVLDANPL